MSLDIIAKLNDLVPNPGCVYNALDSILASCNVPEDTNERTRLSVRLSVCEFEAAKVSYPSACYDAGNIAVCTQLLETKPTWWTTYSGNFRHIRAICQEYRPHFESRRVIEVFKDAGNLFSEFEGEVARTLQVLRASRSEALQNWHHSSENITLELLSMEELVEKLRSAALSANADLLNSVDSLNKLVSQSADELAEASMYTKNLTEEAAAVAERFTKFDEVMNNVARYHNETAIRLRSSIEQSSELLAREISKLQTVLDKVKHFITITGFLLKMIGPFPLMCVVFFALLIVARKSRVKVAPSSQLCSAKSDLLFY